MKFGTLSIQIFLLVFIFCGIGWTAESDEMPNDSLYRIQSHWKNQEGKEAPLKGFSGEFVVVAMTYTGCQYSCPMTINKLEEIEKDFKKKGLKRYHFIVASFDPIKDTPKTLKAYMKKRKLNPENWTFLSAPSDEEVRKLAVLLDITYQKIDGGDFSHSNAITLLDPAGRIGTRLKGTSSPHEELVVKVAGYEKTN